MKAVAILMTNHNNYLWTIITTWGSFGNACAHARISHLGNCILYCQCILCCGLKSVVIVCVCYMCAVNMAELSVSTEFDLSESLNIVFTKWGM